MDDEKGSTGQLIAPAWAPAAWGCRAVLMSLGALAPAAVAASWPALRRLGGRTRIRDADIDILRAVPMLGVLPAVTIEQLAPGLPDRRDPVPRERDRGPGGRRRGRDA
jgi:hypothetical protein